MVLVSKTYTYLVLVNNRTLQRDPSASKSNQLHANIFRVFLYVESINSSKTIVSFFKSWTSADYFSNSTGGSS